MGGRGYGAAVSALAAAGALVSGYLSWYKLFGGSLWCVGGAGCDIVNNSPQAMFFGVPVAFLGLGTYLALLALGLQWWRGGAAAPAWVPLACTGLATVGWIYSAYLTWLEAFVILAWCTWCLISFAVITLLLGVSLLGALR